MQNTWTKRILDLLADNEWHDYSEVLDVAVSEVDGDYGFEVGEYYRQYKYVRAGRLIPTSKLGRGKTSETGKRVVVSRSIAKLRKSGIVEIETEEQGRRHRRHKPMKMRLRPEEQ